MKVRSRDEWLIFHCVKEWQQLSALASTCDTHFKHLPEFFKDVLEVPLGCLKERDMVAFGMR
jgi:hypothetical protein